METIEKILIVGVIILVLALPLSMKFFGATDVPKLVEQDGYCKIVYGDGIDYMETENKCSNGQTFTEEQFREICPRVHVYDLRFYSDCFYKGGQR